MLERTEGLLKILLQRATQLICRSCAAGRVSKNENSIFVLTMLRQCYSGFQENISFFRELRTLINESIAMTVLERSQLTERPAACNAAGLLQRTKGKHAIPEDAPEGWQPHFPRGTDC
jgi:hypothetical protein